MTSALLVVPDRLLDLAQVGVGKAQVAKVGALAPAVADLAVDHQRLLVVPDRLLDLARSA